MHFPSCFLLLHSQPHRANISIQHYLIRRMHIANMMPKQKRQRYEIRKRRIQEKYNEKLVDDRPNICYTLFISESVCNEWINEYETWRKKRKQDNERWKEETEKSKPKRNVENVNKDGTQRDSEEERQAIERKVYWTESSSLQGRSLNHLGFSLWFSFIFFSSIKLLEQSFSGNVWWTKVLKLFQFDSKMELN